MLTEQTIPTPIAPQLRLTPAADLFAQRGRRLRQLAATHTLGPWLSWLAELCAAQQLAFERQASSRSDDADGETTPSTPPSIPPARIAEIRSRLISFLPTQAPPGVTRYPRFAIDITPSELTARLERNRLIARGEAIGAGRELEDLLIAASMQVAWSVDARQTATSSADAANVGACPHCGSVAVGSVILAGEGRAGLRYQECCLCATRWNSVRARCTLCDSGSVVQYLSLEGEYPAVAAETCDQCHAYTKLFFQSRDIQVDPTADDLATLALDVLVGEQGYARAAPNLLLCEGEAA